MKKNVIALVWVIGIGVPLIAIASGGYYLFHSENTKNADISAQIAAKAPATDTTNSSPSANSPAGIFTRGSGGTFIPAAYIKNAYVADNEAVTDKTDVLFSNPTTANPEIIIKTDPNVQAHIDTMRAEITTTLNDWKALVQDVNQNGPSQSSDASVQQYANDVEQYISELKLIIDNLTPDNSGLTPEEIAKDQVAVDAAIQEADQAIAIIDTPPPPPSSPPPPLPPPAGQNISPTDQGGSSSGQDNSSNGQTGSGSGSGDSSNGQTGSGSGSGDSSSGTNDSNPPPPPLPPPNYSGAPQLIEGSNSI